MPTVADNVIATLRANGITRAYGIPGDSLNGFTEAMRRDGSIAWKLVRHEESAAFAAAADAELTGQMAVVLGSCGPGNLHLINGLFDAQRSRVPVLAIAAQIPSAEIGSGYFQETHPQNLFQECSVYCEMVSDPAQMPRMLQTAMRAAIQQRGVAVLVVPGDVALAEAQETMVTTIERARARVVPAADQLQRASDLLSTSKRTTLLVGVGAEGAKQEVLELADTLGAPVVHSLRGKQHVEGDNPFDVGLTGLLGFASGYRAMDKADTILMLGTDFPYRQFYPETAKIIQVDLRGEQLGRRAPLELGLVGDVRETVRELLPMLRRNEDRRHLDESCAHYKRTREDLDDLAVPAKRGRPIHPQYVAKLINDLADEDAVVIPDVGSPVVYASRYFECRGERRVIGSFLHGSMANAVPHAIGAQVAHPERQVITLSGDGGLAMLMGEMLTVGQYDLPITIVVLNNSSLNFVELEMKAAGLPDFGTHLDNPDFSKVAESVGMRGIRVTESAELESALREALAHDGPALVDVVTDRQELTIPPAISAEQIKGFTLYALRTVMSGRGDELLDLSRSNLRQIF
ncbi:ubiquinone-dependent pyruvate dehydrogenase [Janibacter cremeus]|uniref:Pyruvate dehydrogenase (Quinone) n=1 Tax=Janibacter cremeus TaxID=1285192 RepID=A0A852VNW1_9MICO|nr:ubiquinone-dependent pyruvate dehydrogenase [Janibacter cremeus]NYF97150.1 pyruvate dehydrogenase (quinone) [Janibacter cremeus]